MTSITNVVTIGTIPAVSSISKRGGIHVDYRI